MTDKITERGPETKASYKLHWKRDLQNYWIQEHLLSFLSPMF